MYFYTKLYCCLTLSMSIPLCSVNVFSLLIFSQHNKYNKQLPYTMVIAHVSTHMSHHHGNLEPLNIFEFLLTALCVSKAADPCVSSGWPSVLVWLLLPAGIETCAISTVKSNYLLYLLCWLKINKLNTSTVVFDPLWITSFVTVQNFDMIYKKVKVKRSHYRPMGPRRFWEIKDSRFRDIGTLSW
jgi:hypothetical protein